MYTGPQFLYAMQGVQTLRNAFGPSSVDVRIISAGYGLINEDRRIVPYEVTFSHLSLYQIGVRARLLNIPESVAQVSASYPITIFLLGREYRIAADVPTQLLDYGRHVFLCRPGGMGSLAPGTTAVPMDQHMMHILGAGQIAAKGKAFSAFAQGLAHLGGAGMDSVLRDDSPACFVETVKEGLR